jgi:putative tryptophan/tyrosine transport system substrate-binding protein
VITRRGVLALLAASAVPPTLVAGEPPKVFRLGVLSPLPPGGPGYRAFVERLQALGWEEGRNLQIDFVEFDSTDADRSAAMAAKLVGRGVDVIVAFGPEVAVKSAVSATRSVPIVMVANDYDPIAKGYIANLARPGGNVTGVFFQQIELTAKRLDFLTQAFPDLARVVVLWDRISADQFAAAQEAARLLKIQLHGIECVDRPYDYDRALAGVDGEHRDVLLQMTSPLFAEDRKRLPMAALRRRLPSMYPVRQFVDAGGLMSYGVNQTTMNHLTADYVDRIAKGAKPADLPVQQPMRFELAINLKTAAALGLTIPQTILLLADEVIE